MRIHAQLITLSEQMRRLIILTALCMLSLTPCMALSTQGTAPSSRQPGKEKVTTRLLLILDCSNSMWDRWQSNSKIKVTQTVLLKFLDSIASEPDFEVALRVFGHLNKDAYGTRLEVPFEANNKYKIQSKIKTLVPQGGCTIDKALTNSLNDFPATDGSRNIILIVTDGIDDCDGNICQVAQQVQRSGIVVQTFILGIGRDNGRYGRLDCAGRFSPVPDEEQFTQALYNILSLSEEKAQVVLQVMDESGHVYETEMPVAFYDANTGIPRLVTSYCVDDHFAPDTLMVDPLVNYDVTLFTMPATTLYGRQFPAGRATRMNVVVPQGVLLLRYEDRRSNVAVPAYPVLVHQEGRNEVLNMQPVGDRQSYLAGVYDLEVLSVPPMRLPGVVIQPSASTELVIPMPGVLNISKPRGMYAGNVLCESDGSVSLAAGLDAGKTSERLLLMPGTYRVLLKPQGSTQYEKVVIKQFTIEPGMQTNVNF